MPPLSLFALEFVGEPVLEPTEGTKQCAGCGQVKSAGDFYADRRARDGLHSSCKPCHIQRTATYHGENPEVRQRHRERQSEKKRRWRAQASDEALARERENTRRSRIKRLYGLAVEEYEGMIAAQDNACAVCRSPFDDEASNRHLDHCHRTGAIRAFLCRACNTSLGLLEEDPKRIMALARYITDHDRGA